MDTNQEEIGPLTGRNVLQEKFWKGISQEECFIRLKSVKGREFSMACSKYIVEDPRYTEKKDEILSGDLNLINRRQDRGRRLIIRTKKVKSIHGMKMKKQWKIGYYMSQE
jgi:hypothetical protein